MRSMVLTGIRELELREAPEPGPPAAGEVQIRLTHIGVCGSDVHYYTEGRIGSQVVQYPYRVGHECAGVVEAVGSGVTGMEPGTRLAIDPAMPCWRCDQCRRGRENTCSDLGFLGTPGQAEGCLCDRIRMPATSCFPIPDSLSLEEAAFCEPLSIGIYALGLAGLPAEARIGILGCGPIGLSVLLPALAGGVGAAYVTDRLDARVLLAEQQGAVWAGNPDADDVVAAIGQREPEGLDVVFECCGQQEAVDQALRLLRPGGKLVLIGIPPILEHWSFATDLTRRKELVIQNVRRQRGCVQTAIDMLAQQHIDVRPLVTHRFPLEQTREAFELVDAYSEGVVKAMVEL